MWMWFCICMHLRAGCWAISNYSIAISQGLGAKSSFTSTSKIGRVSARILTKENLDCNNMLDTNALGDLE
jgi:hypothetical protein